MARVFDGEKVGFFSPKLLDDAPTLRYDARMNLTDAINDPIHSIALRDMMLATALDPFDYNDDDFEPSTADDDEFDAICDAERAMRSDYLALLDRNDATEIAHLALALEICPIHLCDLEICDDDDPPECRHHRN